MQVAVGKTYVTHNGRVIKIEKIEDGLIHWRRVDGQAGHGISSEDSFLTRVKEEVPDAPQ